jgi:cytidylate kinase
MNLTAEVQQDIDHRVDAMLQDLYRTQEALVIDSRMAWHWMPESFKIFLILDPETASHRIFDHIKAGGRVSEDAQSIEEVRASIDRRFASEQKRYADLYQVNPTDPHNFDIVLNTKKSNLETITAMALATFTVWQKS